MFDSRGPAMDIFANGPKALSCYCGKGSGAEFVGDTCGVVATGKGDHGVLGITKGSAKAGVYGYDGSPSGFGVAGKTGNGEGAGVVGENTGEGPGVLGATSLGNGVQGRTVGDGKAGVWGTNDARFLPAFGVFGETRSALGAGVCGRGLDSSGVLGLSGTFHGIVGSANRTNRCGVIGINAGGIGVGGKSMTGYGVVGESSSKDGVFGISTGPGFFAGVVGVSTRGIGVSAQALDPKSNAVGLYARAPQVAAIFDGDVLVKGNLSVASDYNFTVVTPGNKNGVVAFADGTHRLVCAIESPEAWFEDFGEKSLVKGKARVRFDPAFAQTVDTKRYHVFLTPYGETAGLYVAQRTRGGFDVAERKPGKSSIRFSWRVVAKPKFIKNKRFAKTTTPQTLEGVHSAIERDHRRGKIDVTVLKTNDIDMQVRKVSKLFKRIKPRLPEPPKLPKLPTRSQLKSDTRRLMEKDRKPNHG
jgi:hypothetical protein